MEEVIATYIPNYLDWIGSFVGQLGQFFAGGILVCFMVWTVAFAVDAVFGWLANRGGD